MVRMKTGIAALLASVTLGGAGMVHAEEASQAELELLKKDIEDLRRRLSAAQAPAPRTTVDKALDSKGFGPNAAVTTKTGKLSISGLVQVWYYTIENDNKGLFEDPAVNGIADTNEALDNDSFRVRRTEIKFNMDIHENITAVIMLDPAREATSFPNFPNTSTSKRTLNVNLAAVQSGAGAVPRLLQDAYINYHGVVPHHDFQIGQFKPAFGEEGIRSSSQLDFVERSMIGLLGDARDTGAQVHGTWWDDRFQYWAGLFNSPGNFHGSSGQQQNRSDDNDEKDVAFRFLVRPLWGAKTSDCACEGIDWGNLELGASAQLGTHGEAGGRKPQGGAVNGLDRRVTSASRYGAWLYYAPGGPVRGWWIRGEYAYFKDRNAPGAVLDPLGRGDASELLQDQGANFAKQGWFVSTGYKFSESRWVDCGLPSWLKNVELAFRFQTFDNVEVADLVDARHTDVFDTDVYTFGVNYYIKGHNAKIQLNYNIVDNPESGNANRIFHNVQNDSFVVNFQVAF